MAGNKHKNGIVCMFPGCEKKMRTQKFKGHFVKAHLREGEEYTVDHRRQYEVAQTEPLADSDTASATASPMELMGASAGVVGTPKVKSEPVKRASLDMAKKVADAMAAGMADFSTEPPRLVEPEEASVGEQAAAPLALPQAVVVAPSPTPAPAQAPVRAKRPAAAISNDSGAPPALPGVLPPGLDESTMVKMLLLMDRRFTELSAKMDEMVEMQRLLFSAIMSKDVAAVEEQAAKKRKESASNTTIV